MRTARIKYLSGTVFFLFCLLVSAQQETSDSLTGIIRKSENKLLQARAYLALSEELFVQDIDTVIPLCEKAIALLDQLPAKESVTPEARSIRSSALNNIGYVYDTYGRESKALSFYLQALKLREQINHKSGLVESYNNIASLYRKQGSTARALDFYRKGLVIAEETGDKKGLSNILNNMGVIYARDTATIDEALGYYLRSLDIEKELNDLNGIGNRQNNIAVIYHNKGEVNKAREFYKQSLETKKLNEDDRGLMNTLHSLANLEFEQGKTAVAKDLAEKSLALAQQMELNEGVEQAAYTLYEILSAAGKWEEALRMHELFEEAKSKSIDASNLSETTQLQMQFEFDKKLTADSLVAVEEKKVIAARFTAERTQRFALYGGLILAAIFASFMYHRFKITKKQKVIIEAKERETRLQKIVVEQQKHLIEEKHKEITDSINYAERIQRALLASKILLEENLPSYFLLFKPKDVVSGDFYWAGKLANGHFGLIVADSTGHGVPGAIMSMLNISCIDKAVTKGISSPDAILNETRKLIIENLKNDGSAEGGKDGMDGSFVAFDFSSKKIHVASANNPVWIIRKNDGNVPELLVLKADRMPVGKHDKSAQPFTLETVEVKDGDLIYLLSDGYADQFGGPNGKKFKYKPLQEVLLSVCDLPMAVQKQKLEESFTSWKGQFEQVDDVCVMGIKV